VLHVHDELVAEIAIGAMTEAEFLALVLEPPPWAEGLPLAGTVWSGAHYLEPPDVKNTTPTPPAIESAINAIVTAVPSPAVTLFNDIAAEGELDDAAPLWHMVSVPLTSDNKTTCPFHESDDTPSLQFFPDHYHCFGCRAHGSGIDWFIRGEGMTREEAIIHMRDWRGSPAAPMHDGNTSPAEAANGSRALALWAEAGAITGTVAERYLADTRHIDLAALPDINRALRFHPCCPFGPGTCHPCLIALMREALTDTPTGIQRIALTPDAQKIDRRMLGRTGAVKLWPAGAQLVAGEGLETVLAAASRVPYRGEPLRPAWAMLSAGALGKLPVLPGVKRLIILVDHDENGEGQAAATRCMERWTRAGRTVVRLLPRGVGSDFNDLILPAEEEPVS
jgi:hypothetical protein